MKTIIVIYTNEKLNLLSEIGKKKKYAFNTDSEVEVGDLIKSEAYDTNMQIVKILGKTHKYFNASTGELSDEYNSTLQWEIRKMIISDKLDEEVVFASKL